MPWQLSEIVGTLLHTAGLPGEPARADPWELIVWEYVAYLADDSKRAEAFGMLRDRVGMAPESIAAANPEVLEPIMRLGGIHPDVRAARLVSAAALTLTEFDGDLTRATKLPLALARKALTHFPGIGDPGADKILLFTGAYPLLALVSNGLRVMLRLGFAPEAGNYSTEYRAVQRAVEGTFPLDCAWLTCAYLALRRHGRETCRRNGPNCARCPLRPGCAYASTTKEL